MMRFDIARPRPVPPFLRVMMVALTALMAMPLESRAEDYPTHNVIILVPFAPGGGTDLLARAYAQILEKKYDKTFVVESRSGGGTTLAATVTANAPADGYTLMQGTSGTMAMNPTIFKHLSYEPLKTLVPVSLVAGVPFVLTVNPTLPVHSVADLVALAKKRSAVGKPLTYGWHDEADPRKAEQGRERHSPHAGDEHAPGKARHDWAR